MTDLPEGHELVDHVVFSPAERALIREKVESMKVDLDLVYDKATTADSPGLMRSFIDVITTFDYLNQIMAQKSKALVLELLNGKMGHDHD